MSRVEIIGDATLYLGDAREIVSTLGLVDATICDPPYGVNGGSGTLGKASQKTKYKADFPDTAEYIHDVCAPIIAQCLKISKRMAITTGSRNMFKYPPPDDIGGFTHPVGNGLSFWGMITFQPILFYGRDPRIGLTISAMTHPMTSPADKTINHPCPKPIKEWTWLVNKASLVGETVLDPFMGSGTTGVACAKLGRKFIGIELDQKYFDLSCRRIEAAHNQPDMIIELQRKLEKQKAMI